MARYPVFRFYLLALLLIFLPAHASEIERASIIKVTQDAAIHVIYNGKKEYVYLIGVAESDDKEKIANFLREALKASGSVGLEFDTVQRNSRKHLLAYVYQNRTMLNMELLRIGYISLLNIPPTSKHWASFAQTYKVRIDEETVRLKMERRCKNEGLKYIAMEAILINPESNSSSYGIYYSVELETCILADYNSMVKEYRIVDLSKKFLKDTKYIFECGLYGVNNVNTQKAKKYHGYLMSIPAGEYMDDMDEGLAALLDSDIDNFPISKCKSLFKRKMEELLVVSIDIN